MNTNEKESHLTAQLGIKEKRESIDSVTEIKKMGNISVD